MSAADPPLWGWRMTVDPPLWGWRMTAVFDSYTFKSTVVNSRDTVREKARQFVLLNFRVWLFRLPMTLYSLPMAFYCFLLSFIFCYFSTNYTHFVQMFLFCLLLLLLISQSWSESLFWWIQQVVRLMESISELVWIFPFCLLRQKRDPKRRKIFLRRERGQIELGSKEERGRLGVVE